MNPELEYTILLSFKQLGLQYRLSESVFVEVRPQNNMATQRRRNRKKTKIDDFNAL
jgi:hypothetical protein